MAVITLTTDFGTIDEYAGVMKGAVLKANPHVSLVDISHHIPAFDVMAAARMLNAAFHYFPDKTVHVVVVDPGVGSQRGIIAFDMEHHRFLVPDNGIPAYLIRGRTVDAMVRLKTGDEIIKGVSATFHGRDLFAPAAARMADGLPLSSLGADVDPATLVSVDVLDKHLDPENRVHGIITFIDHFGNVITDLDRGALTNLFGEFKDEYLEVTLNHRRVRGLFHHYGQVSVASPLMVIGSRGYLEIAVNCGSAKDYFKVATGDGIWVSINPEAIKKI